MREPILSPKDIERFWSHVDVRGPNDCWPWLLSCNDRGYGRFNTPDRQLKAHRVAFFLANGHWPEPCGLHECDNPPCCNSAHIFEGNDADNNADKRAKGRDKDFTSERVRGSKNPHAKLTEEDVQGILSLLAAGYGPSEIGRRYGIVSSAMSEIKAGKKWTHVSAARDGGR